jgi:hypothetical protein
MLFQASALPQTTFDPPPSRALTAPALGRVAPIAIEVQPDELEPSGFQPLRPPLQSEEVASPSLAVGAEAATSFWPLVKVEVSEALLLGIANALALGLPALVLGVSPSRLLTGAWPFLVPYLFSVSWMLFLGPLVLTGQSPLMGHFGVTLPENAPERRMSFSLMHLISVACFPVSFLCMVLGARHQTLAEILSGQELLARPVSRLR